MLFLVERVKTMKNYQRPEIVVETIILDDIILVSTIETNHDIQDYDEEL